MSMSHTALYSTHMHAPTRVYGIYLMYIAETIYTTMHVYLCNVQLM